MKYLFSVLSIVLLLAACSSPSKNEMVLTGEIDGLKKGTLFLQKVDDTVLISVDSVLINGDEIFSFTTPVESPEMFYLVLKSEGEITKERVGFFAEPSEIQISSSLKNFGLDAVVTGSINNDKLSEYSQLIKRFTNKNLELIEESFKARQQGNDSLAAALQQQQNRLLSSKYLATVNFAVNNGDYEVAPYLMLTEVYDVNPKFMDTVYNALTPKIKDSKYGKALESFMKNRSN